MESNGVKMIALTTGGAGILYAIRKPLKKAIVFSISGVLIAKDKIVERVSTFKENIEDIIAEAQYENMKCKADMPKSTSE